MEYNKSKIKIIKKNDLEMADIDARNGWLDCDIDSDWPADQEYDDGKYALLDDGQILPIMEAVRKGIQIPDIYLAN